MTIQDAIRQLACQGLEMYAKVCTVDKVDETARTIDCTPVDEGAPLLGVNLQANQESEVGLVAIPAVGSYVVIAFLSPAVAVVVLADKIDKHLLTIGETNVEITDGMIDIKIEETTIQITADGTVINGGKLGGMIKIKELTDKINALIDKFNSHTHEIASGGVAVTGSATAQANAAPVMVPAITAKAEKVKVSDYEDEKVKH